MDYKICLKGEASEEGLCYCQSESEPAYCKCGITGNLKKYYSGCVPYTGPYPPPQHHEYDHLPSDKQQVCVSPYSSSSDNRSYVTNLCNINKDCKGYYAGGNDDEWYIATDTDPLQCNDRHINPEYRLFHSKESNYGISQFVLGYYGCQLKMSNICEGTSNVDCKSYVEPLCNLDPNCTGYYSDAKGTYVATNTDPNNDNHCDTYLYKPPSDIFNTFSRKK
jgi:hypothetical protein